MASDSPKTIRVAAVQAEPEWNDLQKGVDKTVRLITELARMALMSWVSPKFGYLAIPGTGDETYKVF